MKQMYLMCFLALLVTLSSAAPYGSSYGAAAPMLTTTIVKPVIKPVSMDQTIGYGSGYAAPQMQVQRPIIVHKDIVVPPAPVMTAYSKPVVSYAAPAPVVTVPKPVLTMDTGYAKPIVTMPKPVFTAPKPIVHMDSGYAAAEPIVAKPIVVKPVMDVPVTSYAAPVAPVMHMEVPVTVEAPEFRELCLSNKNAYGLSVARSVFYVPHPTKQSFYIQCDEFGKAFLKECPAGTIFTLNLACENVNDLHAIEAEKPAVVQMDQTVGAYGSAPVFTAESSHVETARVEVITEAPEFRELCTSKQNAYGVQTGLKVFYIPHPTKQSFYIQCDEFGKSFLKECPAGTIFTLNLACENVNDLHEIHETAVETPIVTPPVLTSSLSYNTAPVLSADQTAIVNTHIDIVQEAPEFKEMCLKSRTQGVAVFYLPHPSKQTFFIQCDEFGSAFLKECPANTIFTANLICENINDLHAIEATEEVHPAPVQLDSTVGAYGAAPVFTAPAVHEDTVAQARVEVIVEAPEFNELCQNKNAYGAQVTSTLFYIPHPTIKRDYIQCDEFGKAFLKECPLGMVFTRNLVCEFEDAEPVSMPSMPSPNVVLTAPTAQFDNTVAYQSNSGYQQ